MEIMDSWADCRLKLALKEYEETERVRLASAYAIMNYRSDGDDVPLDLMTREDLVAHRASSSPPTPTLSTLSSPSPHRLIIDPLSRREGNKASLFEATFALAGGPRLNVFMKTYPVEDFNVLIHEFDVYTAVAHLVIVPKLHAVIKARFDPWGGLILEHAGTTLSSRDVPWKDLELTQQEKLDLYDAFRQLHAAGVVHGDVAARNILRRPSGAFCLVDFDRSSLNHVCPGPTCEELARLQRNLGLKAV
ncbi:hypothetical protein DFH07DRAFT_942001 [Mycena maculata]|uniref:Protein kinase domain-containing protein n=1 Tax=Mycena maculata TaxID=230809 RepID=A0AAD7IT21_9AGAR|nr:hypothetical protein DFH07DRAFT_942001 [Mycena maculata]